MSETDYRHIFKNGVWTQNTGFVALLGLCPLLAMSNSVVNGLGLGPDPILENMPIISFAHDFRS